MHIRVFLMLYVKLNGPKALVHDDAPLVTTAVKKDEGTSEHTG